MSPRIMKSLAKFAAAATLVSAAALTATALPASASATATATPKLELWGASTANQVVICTPPGTHGVEQDVLFGITAVTNQCGTRVWLHEFSDGSGWSYCISPRTQVVLPASVQFPQQLLVSENTAAC